MFCHRQADEEAEEARVHSASKLTPENEQVKKTIDNCGSSVRGLTLMSRDGGDKGEAELWLGQQLGDEGLFAVKVVGTDLKSDLHMTSLVRDVMRRDIVELRDILNGMLDSDLR